ncbi:hypothetical protein ACWGJT_02260 [Streptomyces xantholiticus]|uniref:Uncharacterized protein n=1 Tax=Streptomyces xantholiticus TaxID=68285 RepID=A0ABV1UVR1_9ACTN
MRLSYDTVLADQLHRDAIGETAVVLRPLQILVYAHGRLQFAGSLFAVGELT